jgi:o-succinylbenzoate synthase
VNIWYHPYQLQSPWHGLGHNGVLLKIEFPRQVVGFSDLHPWPELGDGDLASHLKSIREVKPTPLVRRMFELAKMDGEARAAGRSLFTGFRVPLNHKLVPDFLSLTPEKLQGWYTEGYRVAKVKMGKNLVQETRHLYELLERGGRDWRWRLDFNGRLSAEEFSGWASFAGSLIPFVDGIEDPVALEEVTELEESQFPIFNDRVFTALATGAVIKPEIQGVPQIHTGKVWFTNNLGHPFGHAVALALAARANLESVCGLQGLESYEPSQWREALPYYGPCVLAPQGTGFGCDALLARVPWRKNL